MICYVILFLRRIKLVSPLNPRIFSFDLKFSFLLIQSLLIYLIISNQFRNLGFGEESMPNAKLEA